MLGENSQNCPTWKDLTTAYAYTSARKLRACLFSKGLFCARSPPHSDAGGGGENEDGGGGGDGGRGDLMLVVGVRMRMVVVVGMVVVVI